MYAWQRLLIFTTISFASLAIAAPPSISPSGAVLSNRSTKKAFAQPSFNSEMVVEVVGRWLCSINEDKLGEAYWNISSSAYRNTTPWENFWYFIEQFPVLREHLVIDMEGIVFRDGFALFTANLLNEEGCPILYLEAHLEIERGKWKIMGMRLMDAK